ncbi:MAG: FAD binding domain-containing protein [Thermoplasmatota archaeon]
MSMLLPPFTLHEPTSVKEALELKARHPDSDWLAGGSDLLPNYKWGLNARKHVVSLARVAELREIRADRIGALARLREMERDAELRANVPVLAKTASMIASPLIRETATLGGNLLLENRCFFFNQSFAWRESKNFCMKADGTECLVVPQATKCYATFSADLPAPLITLGAEFELASEHGARRVKVAEFYAGDGIERNVRKPGELLTFVHVPAHAQKLRAAYVKLRQRESWDFPELGIAVAGRFDGRGHLEELHLVANALEMTPIALDRLAEPHLGRPLDDAAVAAIAKGVEENVRPVKNTSFPPSYRKKMSRVFTARALREIHSA